MRDKNFSSDEKNERRNDYNHENDFEFERYEVKRINPNTLHILKQSFHEEVRSELFMVKTLL